MSTPARNETLRTEVILFGVGVLLVEAQVGL